MPEPDVSDPASTPLTTNIPAPLSTLFPAPSQNTSPPTNQESPRHTIFPLNLNLSSDEDDEFLDFDSDVGQSPVLIISYSLRQFHVDCCFLINVNVQAKSS